MDSSSGSRANLKKYIKVARKWRFVPVFKQNGIPYPGKIILAGRPVRSNSGTFYLEYYENGRRVQKPVGQSPREAKDAWYSKMSTVPPEDMAFIAEDSSAPELTSIESAFSSRSAPPKKILLTAPIGAIWSGSEPTWIESSLPRWDATRCLDFSARGV